MSSTEEGSLKFRIPKQIPPIQELDLQPTLVNAPPTSSYMALVYYVTPLEFSYTASGHLHLINLIPAGIYFYSIFHIHFRDFEGRKRITMYRKEMVLIFGM